MNRFTRRKLLQYLVVGGAAATIPFPFQPVRHKPSTPAAGLGDVYPHADSAAAIGRRYLMLAPYEADATRLAARLLDAAAVSNSDHGFDATTLRAAFARLRRDDFRHGRVVSVDGWVLSLTEARLCAIAALTHGAART